MKHDKWKQRTWIWLVAAALLLLPGCPPAGKDPVAESAAESPDTDAQTAEARAAGSQTNSSNVVLWQSFEDGQTGGWEALPWGDGGEAAVSADQASDGERSLKFTNRTPGEASPAST